MKATCTDKLLRMLGTSCSELTEGIYGIQITKNNTSNCDCCSSCSQGECNATLVLIPSTPAPVLPNAPTGGAVTDSNGGAYDCGDPILTWIASTTSGVTYTIREGATIIASLISGTSYILTGVSDGLHTYTIEAVNANGSSTPISVSLTKTTCATAPNPVTSVLVTDSNGGAYDCGDPIITWVASTTPGAIYTIKEGAATIASGLSTTSYTISGATIGNHTYTVEAYNGVGSSAGVSVSVNVVACLSAPGNVTGTINVYNSGTAVNYTCGTGFDVDFTDVATATYYQLFEGATQIGSNSSTSNFVVTGQSVGSHTYTIYACNGAGCSTGTNFTTTIVDCGPTPIFSQILPSQMNLVSASNANNDAMFDLPSNMIVNGQGVTNYNPIQTCYRVKLTLVVEGYSYSGGTTGLFNIHVRGQLQNYRSNTKSQINAVQGADTYSGPNVVYYHRDHSLPALNPNNSYNNTIVIEYTVGNDYNDIGTGTIISISGNGPVPPDAYLTLFLGAGSKYEIFAC